MFNWFTRHNILIRRINRCSEPLIIGVGNCNLVGASTRNWYCIGGCSCIGDSSAALVPLVSVVGIGRIAIRITSNYRSGEDDTFLKGAITGDGCRSSVAFVGGCG